MLAPDLLPVDPTWFRDVNDFARATPWLHGLAKAFAVYGVVLFGAALLWSWWAARSRGDVRAVAAALWAPLGMLLAVGLNQPLGHLVAEPRPYTQMPGTLVLVARTTDFSFPSDHAVMAGAVATGVLLAGRRLGLLVTAAAVLMAVTRVYVGAHYPSDVVAGVLLGSAVCGLGFLVVRPILLRLVTGLLPSPLRPLLTSVPAAEGR